MNGYSAQQFGPNDPITREQMAAVLWRWGAEPFADESEIAEYARPAVVWARAEGVLNGLGENRFASKASATRVQVATLLMNYTSRAGFTEVSIMDIMCQPCGVVMMEDGSLLVTDGYNSGT